MAYRPINFAEKLTHFSDCWTPRIIARLNDYDLKLVKTLGEFVWHLHEDTDEAFVVLAGEVTIELRDGQVTLGAGEMFVVPRGVEHRPVAARECHMLLIEPRDVVNTGTAGGPLTAETDAWV